MDDEEILEDGEFKINDEELDVPPEGMDLDSLEDDDPERHFH